jgi:hypothetical protein
MQEGLSEGVAHGYIFSAFTFICVVFALWGPDVYELVHPPKDRDLILYTIEFIIFLVFSLEVVGSCILSKGTPPLHLP